MGKVPTKSSELAKLECAENKCTIDLKTKGKVLVFLQEGANATAGTTLDADEMKCFEDDDHAGHDHGHRRLESCGATKCNGKVIISSEAGLEFTNLKVTSKSKSLKLLVYSASGYGQVKYVELQVEDITKEAHHDHSNGAISLARPSSLFWVAAFALMSRLLF